MRVAADAFLRWRQPALAVVVATWACVQPTLYARQAGPAPVTLEVVDVRGSDVTLRWRTAATSAAIDLFLLEGGVAPGQVLASVPIAATSRTLTVALAPGTYYARLHAVLAGARSGPSNEIVVSVGSSRPPTTPGDVRLVALGTDVALSWTPTFGGGRADRIVLDVYGTANGTVSLPAGDSVLFRDVPHGNYVVALRAVNAAGSSPPSPPQRLELPWNPVRPLSTPAQPPSASKLDVRYEDFAVPRLAELAQREGLSAIVQGARSEFETILKVKDWVAAQWAFSMPVPYPPWDALTILDWIRDGVTGGFCGQYSQVFLQSLAALGIPARYVEIGTPDVPFLHFTTEVWSNDYNKWVAIDPTFDNYFARGGVPLSVLEVRDALLDRRLDDVDVVLGSAPQGPLSPFDWPERSAGLYYYVRYHLNANHLSAPDEHPFDRFNDMVEWLDGRTVPWHVSTVPSEYPHYLLTERSTGDRALVDWRPNQVWITARQSGSMNVSLDLQHSVLHFSHYEWRTIDRSGHATPWQTTTAASVTWSLDSAQRVAEVRGVNVKGVVGPVSSVQLVMP